MNRIVRLPFETKVRTIQRGPVPVGTVKPGDDVVGYNMEARQGRSITISGTRSIGRASAVSVLLLGVSHITMADDTVIVTRTGERRIADSPTHLIGTCILNPNQLLTRNLSLMIPVPDPEVVELVWEGPNYLLAEGCLVGAYDEQ